jgi:hypothetical protein
MIINEHSLKCRIKMTDSYSKVFDYGRLDVINLEMIEHCFHKNMLSDLSDFLEEI